MATQLPRKTQAQWDAERQEAKAKAAQTVKANAEQAKDDLDALRQRQLEENTALAERTASDATVEPVEDEEVGYDSYTVADLQGFLKERDLPVSGNKDELIARLEESDNQ